MPKTSYKVPSSIAGGIWNHEIPLTNNSNVRMVPIKVIACGLLWTLVNLYYIKVLISEANIFITILYLLWAIIAGVFLFRTTKTQELAVMQAMAFVNYAPKPARHVSTRRISKPAGFYNVVGIKEVHPDGLIEYTDNTYGRAMLVVGSASRLLFDDDRDAILDAVQLFWQKVPTEVELIQMTTKEPQRIHHQVDAMQQRMYNLSVDSDDLKGLIEENFERMRTVGSKFLSTHQYLIIKSESKESIDSVISMVVGEVEYNGRVFQSYAILDNPQSVYRMLKPIYEGRQGFDVMSAQIRRNRKRLKAKAA